MRGLKLLAFAALLVSLLSSLVMAQNVTPQNEVFRWKMLYLLYPNTFADQWREPDFENITRIIMEHRDWYENIAGGDLWVQFGFAEVDRYLTDEAVSSVVENGKRKFQLRPDDVRQDLVNLNIPKDIYGTVGGLNAWAPNKYGGLQAGGMAFPGPHLHADSKDTNFWSVSYQAPRNDGFALYHEFTHCVDFVFSRSHTRLGNIDKLRTYVKGVIEESPGWYEPNWSDETMIRVADRALSGGAGLSGQQQARTIRYFLERPHEDFLTLDTDYGEVVPAPAGFQFEPIFHEIYGEPGLRVHLPVIARDGNHETPAGVTVRARVGDAEYQLAKYKYSAATDGIPFTREYFAGWIDLPEGTTEVLVDLVKDGQVTQNERIPVTLTKTAYVKGPREFEGRPDQDKPPAISVQVVESGSDSPVSGVGVQTYLNGSIIKFGEKEKGVYEAAMPANLSAGTYDLVISAVKEGIPVASLNTEFTALIPWFISTTDKIQATLAEAFQLQAQVLQGGTDEPAVEMTASWGSETVLMTRGQDGVFRGAIPGLVEPTQITLTATKRGGPYVTTTVDVVVSGGEIVPVVKAVKVTAGEDAELAIKFVAPDGSCVAGDDIPLVAAMVGWNFAQFKDSDGDGVATAKLSGLAKGIYKVPVKAPGYDDGEITITVE